MKISVFGLGKLGAAIAAVLASKGHAVVGVDVDERTAERLNRGEAPVEETGLADLIAKVRPRLSATTDGVAAAAGTELSILIVPTPSEPSGRFSLDIILQAAAAVGHGLARKSGYHVVVISSTVLPGATEGEIIPALEKASGKRCGIDFGVVYSPEFVALGNVIHDMLHPDIVLIGAADPRAGDAMESLVHSVVENTPSILRMSIVNAEVTKLAVNTYVTTKISFANMLAEICERLPGADARVVTAGIGRDSRIGSKFILPGAAYGGPCFPRDNKALSYLASSLGTRAVLAEATDQVNGAQNARLIALALAKLPPGGQVAILGMSYKPQAAIIEESAGYHLAKGLTAKRVPVTVYDPLAGEHARAMLGDTVAFAASAQECLAQADVAVIATPWKEFASLDYAAGGRKRVVIDCWHALDGAAIAGRADYIALGVGRERAQ